MTTRVERMKAALETAFAPIQLEIEDQSKRHANHAGRNGLPAGETHYLVAMVSAQFSGVSRLERQRAVNAALAAEFDSGLHALSLRLQSPEEHAALV